MRKPKIIEQAEPLLALGLGTESSDATIARDAARLGARYAASRAKGGGRAPGSRPFVAATTGYEPSTGRFRYAMGEVVEGGGEAPEGLERILVPAGTYAAFTVRPLLGFLWGPAIGAAYAYAYGRWLPASAWERAPGPLAHLEYHDERSRRRRRPEIEIRIPVLPRGGAGLAEGPRPALPA